MLRCNLCDSSLCERKPGRASLGRSLAELCHLGVRGESHLEQRLLDDANIHPPPTVSELLLFSLAHSQPARNLISQSPCASMDQRLHFSQWDGKSVYILWEASSEAAVCLFLLSVGWNADMAGFGATVLDLEVETDKDGRVIMQKEHGVGIPHRSL